MPVVILKKVVAAVKAFDRLEKAKKQFNDAYNKLNDAESQEFTRLSGVVLAKQKEGL